MSKKDKNKKAKPSTKLELVFTIVPVLLAVLFLWRSIPDGIYRLDLGQSDVGEKAIALTFDDGPSGHTERLLDGLKQYGVKASFFVIGTQAEKRPEVVKRAYDEGHLIGNHTYDHPNFYITPDSTSIESIEKGEAVIESIIGEKPLFLRAPYGNAWPHQFKHFDRIFIHWTFHTFDWNKDDSQEIHDDIMSKASDGSIASFTIPVPQRLMQCLKLFLNYRQRATSLFALTTFLPETEMHLRWVYLTENVNLKRAH